MPRSLKELLARADALCFEANEPEPGDRVTPLLALRLAAVKRAEAERDLAVAVGRARTADLSWRAIGEIVGTSGEAARQRYGRTPAGRTESRTTRASARRATPA